jgi:hypothetical protein
MREKRDEEVEFRNWLRSLRQQPAEIKGNENWNNEVIMETWDYVNQPLPE